MKKVLVVGGAGYIGSHMVKLLHEKGAEVHTLDNLSSGYADSVVAGSLIVGDLSDVNLLDSLFNKVQFDAVIHFASFIQVGESAKEPAKYYRNNVANTLNLLDAMVKYRVKHFIFSSTAAIFGEPEYSPIDEHHPKKPINPYGRTKLMVEEILKDYDKAYGLKSVCLRYFNAAGADPDGKLGERHEPETHLIPLILRAASGRLPHISVFGQDYETADGTCIRDYIHIEDLCEAHWLSLGYLDSMGISGAFNLGNGNGFSVKEVIDTAIRITGIDFSVIYQDRRLGDPTCLVANSNAAKSTLGWKPSYSELATIVEHAWNWEVKLKNNVR